MIPSVWLLNSCFIPGAFIHGGQAHPSMQLVVAEGKAGVQERQCGCRMLLAYQLVGLSKIVALLGAKLNVLMCFPSAWGH